MPRSSYSTKNAPLSGAHFLLAGFVWCSQFANGPTAFAKQRFAPGRDLWGPSKVRSSASRWGARSLLGLEALESIDVSDDFKTCGQSGSFKKNVALRIRVLQMHTGIERFFNSFEHGVTLWSHE